MDGLGATAFTIFMSYFAIVNPASTVPVYLGLTSEYTDADKKIVARRSVIVAVIIIAVFAIIGKTMFEVFGINVHAFRIAGGLVLAMIGFHMMNGQNPPSHHLNEHEKQEVNTDNLDIAISPLAIPLIAGPGSIVTGVTFSASHGIEGIVMTIGTSVIMMIITYVSFIYGDRLIKKLGPQFINVITRVMGLILITIGVVMVSEGAMNTVSKHFQLVQ
jgi:multiple antibiotic resistance protein